MSSTRGVDVYVALKEQVDQNTPVNDSQLETGDFLAFDSESMQGSRQTVTSKAIKRTAVKKRAFVANGTQAAQGGLDFTGSQLVLEKLLPLATHTHGTTSWRLPDGSPAVDGSAPGSYQQVTLEPVSLARASETLLGVRRHRYTLEDGGRLPFFSTFIGLTGAGAGESNFTRKFHGCKINSLSLSMKVNAFLQISTDVQGIRKELNDGTRVPTYPADNVEYSYLFTGASVKMKAGNMATLGELAVSSAELEINHNLNTDDYRLGSDERQSLDEGITELNGSVEMTMGATRLSGAHLNASSGLFNDRAFLERLNLNSEYASMSYLFTDWKTPIVESSLAAGSTRTTLVLTDEPISIQPGDEIQVADLPKVRVASVNVAAKTVVLEGNGLGADPVVGSEVKIPSHLRITLPFVKVEEPDFNVRDDQTIRGTCRFSGYDGITIDHVCKVAS